ncbi:MAG: hypothetical protein KAI25_06115, partial [Hyphomicrobiaceae bacterium]|nr:hypothetical protein [Hyphomicrobiaceae bacterium]
FYSVTWASSVNWASQGLFLMSTRLGTSDTALIEHVMGEYWAFPAVVHHGAPLAEGIVFT